MNCPHCFGKKVEEKNIPQVFDPDLAKDWHPTKMKVWKYGGSAPMAMNGRRQ